MSRLLIGRGFGMGAHDSNEWKKWCSKEERYRLLREMKEEQKDDNGLRRADTASLDLTVLNPVLGDGQVIGWVNAKKASETFRPRTRFPSPPPLPFARIKEIPKDNGKGVVKVTNVYNVPKYGATVNSMYGTVYHQKAIPEHWEVLKSVDCPGTVVKATAGHFLKDDGYWEFGEGRPSRVGRPMWHSFADRPKRVAGVELLSQSLPNLIGNDSLSGTCLSERETVKTRGRLETRTSRGLITASDKECQASVVDQNAREVESQASALLERAHREIENLRWVRSLGFVRENAGNLTGARPSTKNLTRLIPKDQRGPLHPSVPPTPNLQLSTMHSPFKTPLAHSTASALGSTQVHVGKKDVSFYDPQSGGVSKVTAPTSLPPNQVASPHSPRHQDFVPAIPATYRRTLGDSRQAAHLEVFNRTHTARRRMRHERALDFFTEYQESRESYKPPNR